MTRFDQWSLNVKVFHHTKTSLRSPANPAAGFESKDVRTGERLGFKDTLGKAGVAAVKCCVVNPSAQVFIMPQGTSYLQPKEPCIGVDEAWSNASVAAVPVDQ